MFEHVSVNLCSWFLFLYRICREMRLIRTFEQCWRKTRGNSNMKLLSRNKKVILEKLQGWKTLNSQSPTQRSSSTTAAVGRKRRM